MIPADEARKLCSKSEWERVESSFSPVVETLPLSDLKSRSARAGKLHLKSADLARQKHSGSDRLAARRKVEMFAEAVGRFDAHRKLLEDTLSLGLNSTSGAGKEKAGKGRKLNTDGMQDRAERELESRRSHVLSAFAVRGEQQNRRSGAKRIEGHVQSQTRRQQAKRDTKNP
jgi:hypothetical protein